MTEITDEQFKYMELYAKALARIQELEQQVSYLKELLCKSS